MYTSWLGNLLKVKVFSRVRLFATPWTAAHQAPLSMGFSRREHWSGCRCLLRCFLQNWSNCKPVLYLRDRPTGHRSPSSNGYRGHAVSHRKTRCVFLKPWGSNLSQFFSIQFKEVRLDLLAPILSSRIPDEPPRWKVVAEPHKDARILGLQRRIQSRARDEAWSLRAFA